MTKVKPGFDIPKLVDYVLRRPSFNLRGTWTTTGTSTGLPPPAAQASVSYSIDDMHYVKRKADGTCISTPVFCVDQRGDHQVIRRMQLITLSGSTEESKVEATRKYLESLGEREESGVTYKLDHNVSKHAVELDEKLQLAGGCLTEYVMFTLRCKRESWKVLYCRLTASGHFLVNGVSDSIDYHVSKSVVLDFVNEPSGGVMPVVGICYSCKFKSDPARLYLKNKGSDVTKESRKLKMCTNGKNWEHVVTMTLEGEEKKEGYCQVHGLWRTHVNPRHNHALVSVRATVEAVIVRVNTANINHAASSALAASLMPKVKTAASVLAAPSPAVPAAAAGAVPAAAADAADAAVPAACPVRVGVLAAGFLASPADNVGAAAAPAAALAQPSAAQAVPSSVPRSAVLLKNTPAAVLNQPDVAKAISIARQAAIDALQILANAVAASTAAAAVPAAAPAAAASPTRGRPCKRKGGPGSAPAPAGPAAQVFIDLTQEPASSTGDALLDCWLATRKI